MCEMRQVIKSSGHRHSVLLWNSYALIKRACCVLLRDRFAIYGTYLPCHFPCHHALMFPLPADQSSSLTSTQSDDLPVLLQLCNQLITLLDDISVPESNSQSSVPCMLKFTYNLLLVLVTSTLCLNDTLDTVDSARKTLASNERCQVTVQPIDTDAKALSHALETHDLVTLQQLCVST